MATPRLSPKPDNGLPGAARSLMLVMGDLGRAEESVPEFEGYMAQVSWCKGPEAVAEVIRTIIAAAREDNRGVPERLRGQGCSQ